MDSNNESGEYGTFAVWDFKENILRQYSIAYNLMSEYVIKPTYNTEKHARSAVIKLCYPLFPKMYVLNDMHAVNYIAYFMRNPDKYKMLDIQTAFLILQRVCEKIGLTKFEEFKIPKHKAYLENE